MIKNIQSLKRYIFICILFILCLFSTYSLLYSQCDSCPPPAGEETYDIVVPGHEAHVSPGSVLTVVVSTTNGRSRNTCKTCWYYAYNFTTSTAEPWPQSVYQSSCDSCRVQWFEINVPFDDYGYGHAIYNHSVAGGIVINIDSNQNPDPEPEPSPDPGSGAEPGPDKTGDMDIVNTYTGALSMTEKDYSNSDIEFKRYYNNMTLAGNYTVDPLKRWKNPIGVGWQHNCNIYLEEIQQIKYTDTTKGVSVHEGKSTSIYKLLANGNYQPRRGNHSNLKKSENIWKLYKPNGDIYYFGSSGKVDSIVDRNGRKIEFSYSGNYLS